jgi:hypothetical protein
LKNSNETKNPNLCRELSLKLCTYPVGFLLPCTPPPTFACRRLNSACHFRTSPRPGPGRGRARLGEGLDWAAAVAAATPWVEAVRAHPAPFWAMESLLREYPISRPEGLALMRLAEALLRVPDVETAVA